jgi:formylglycine-generating enzyme required for sulfatase activity
MLPEHFRWVTLQFEPEGDVWRLLDIARQLERDGNLEGAATVYDRAFGIEPHNAEVRGERQMVLDALTVEEHGMVFRYIPAGVFLMGNPRGTADEQPWHPVWLEACWLADRPLDWDTYCRLMGYPAPVALPRQPGPGAGLEDEGWAYGGLNRLRLQYCEDHTTAAHDWHEHIPPEQAPAGHSGFDTPPRTDPQAPWTYREKPLICVSWERAESVGERISTEQVRYTLPTEAQWEKAARGGLIGAQHAWGDAPPSRDNCDCDRFRELSILPSTTFPPNGYGLYARNGGVWEWCRDWYDRDYYRASPEHDPEGPETGEEKVLRGGSWADCVDVQTVSFRMACPPANCHTPNIGFRLCRMTRE